MSSLTLQISKSTNLSEILLCYCFKTSSSFSFLRLNFKFLYCLFTYGKYFPNFCDHQIVISITLSYYDCTLSGVECHLLFINMWSIWLWVCLSGEVLVYLWMIRCGNIVILITKFSGAANFTILTPLSSISWWKLSFSTLGLKIFSLSLQFFIKIF